MVTSRDNIAVCPTLHADCRDCLLHVDKRGDCRGAQGENRLGTPLACRATWPAAAEALELSGMMVRIRAILHAMPEPALAAALIADETNMQVLVHARDLAYAAMLPALNLRIAALALRPNASAKSRFMEGALYVSRPATGAR
jgi:hypothetical protein